ncbi:MAG: general secretion pathway protein GspB [candidate division Zixibacteria bacterium]|nr:general secretion pathway protein GspB [candidate division Zixibacteria bacterium]
MTERTRKKLVYVSLVVAVAWGAYNFLIGDTKTSVEKEPIVNTISALEQPLSISDSISTTEIESAHWGNDPFQAGIPTATQPENKNAASPLWVLSGIVFSLHSPMAIINQKTVRSGDTVDNAEVVSIEQNYVVLRYKEESFRLTVTKG